MRIGRGTPVAHAGPDAAAQKVLVDEYNDKPAQMHGTIVQHTVTGSGPWAICAAYSRTAEEAGDGAGEYKVP